MPRTTLRGDFIHQQYIAHRAVANAVDVVPAPGRPLLLSTDSILSALRAAA